MISSYLEPASCFLPVHFLLQSLCLLFNSKGSLMLLAMDYVSEDEYLFQDYEPSRSVGRQVCHRDLVSSQGFTPCISVIARDWVDISDSAAWTSLEIPAEAEGLSLHRSWRSPSCPGSPVRLAPSGFPHWLEWHRVVEWVAQRAHWPVSLQRSLWGQKLTTLFPSTVEMKGTCHLDLGYVLEANSSKCKGAQWNQEVMRSRIERESLKWSEPSGQEGPRMMMVAVADYLFLVLTLVCTVLLHTAHSLVYPWALACSGMTSLI